MNLVKVLEYEEGFRTMPYLCSAGYVTVGYGTKLHDSKNMSPEKFPIRVSRTIAAEWLHSEIAIKDMRMANSKLAKIYNELSPDRQTIIMSMAYQLGINGVMKFKRMWAALRHGHYMTAAAEMLDSRWAEQTPKRANRHAHIMRHGRLSDVYSD